MYYVRIQALHINVLLTTRHTVLYNTDGKSTLFCKRVLKGTALIVEAVKTRVNILKAQNSNNVQCNPRELYTLKSLS